MPGFYKFSRLSRTAHGLWNIQDGFLHKSLSSSIHLLRQQEVHISGRQSMLGWTILGVSTSSMAIWTGISSSAAQRKTEINGLKNPHKEVPPATSPKPILDLASGDGPGGKSDITSENPQRKESLMSPWRGLSFLRSSIPVPDIASTLSSWTWPATFTSIQSKISALLLELGRGPGSLYSEIVCDAPDLAVHPECDWDAEVRLGDGLCISERAFLTERKRRMKGAFARLFGVSEEDIDERDLPIVAIAGSGGGYRAMMNTIGSLIGAQKSGLLDCATYIAGISGSCWALGALYSGVADSPTPNAAAAHLKERMDISYLDMSTLDLLITAPTNKYLLSGILRKANAATGTVSLTDVYGTLLSARLFVPSNLARLDLRHLSLHNFRRYVDNALLPMPILTAVRHEIPTAMEKPLAEVRGEKQASVDANRSSVLTRKEHEIEERAKWLWFEFTPYEVGCDELGAWIPTWALGRRFENGRSVERIPELSFTILAGICASAFCASLQDYFNEVQPILRQLPTQLYDWLDEIIADRDKELSAMHPVVPNELPNFVKDMSGQLRNSSPPDITDRDTLGFMDAGAELNIPYYPLLRRDVDCIITLDASADSQDLWFTRAEEYAAKRGLSKWPRGARWPAPLESSRGGLVASTSRYSPEESSDPEADAANRELAQAQESEVAGQANKQSESEGRGMPHYRPTSSNPTEYHTSKDLNAKSSHPLPGDTTSNSRLKDALPSSPKRSLNACTIWIGSSIESQESSKMDEMEEKDLVCRDGIAIVYNPLIPNGVVPDFDPSGISTWKAQMDKDESEKLLKVAEANFIEGQEKITRLLKAIWLRKKIERTSRNNEEINLTYTDTT